MVTFTAAASGGPLMPLFVTDTSSVTFTPTVASAPAVTTESWPEAESMAKTPAGLPPMMLKASTTPVEATSISSSAA